MKQYNALWLVVLVFGVGLVANMLVHQDSEASAQIAIPQYMAADQLNQ